MLLKFSNSEKSTTFNNGKGKGKAAKGRLYGDCQVHGRPIEVSLRLISASILKIRQLKKKKLIIAIAPSSSFLLFVWASKISHLSRLGRTCEVM